MTILGMVLSGVIALFGDLVLRKSSSPGAANASVLIIVAAVCFAALAPIWHYLYRSNNFVFVASTYTPVVVICYALLGILYFGDPFSPRVAIAGGLAFAAILVASV